MRITTITEPNDTYGHNAWVICIHYLGLYSQSGKTSYRQILWNLEAARLTVMMIVSVLNLAGISAALPPRWLPNV